MATAVTFRPQVCNAPTVVQQSRARACRENLNKVEEGVRKNELSDIAGMTERMQLESQLNEAKVAPVKYVEEIKPQESLQTAKVSETSAMTKPKNVTDVIRNFHNGKQESRADRANVISQQMNMMAVNNMILHGLF